MSDTSKKTVERETTLPLWFNRFSYCWQNCIPVGREKNKCRPFYCPESDLILTRLCFLCGPRRIAMYTCERPLWACWKTVCWENKPDSCTSQFAVVSSLLGCFLSYLSHSSFHSALHHVPQFCPLFRETRQDHSPQSTSTVLFPLQRNQTGPQSPEHVLQFCLL